MRYSKAFIPTLKEDPSDAVLASHKLMLRAGMIKKVASGIYSYLPFGWRVLQKISQIIREEMDRVGSQEMMMPMVQPKELWEESGRWDNMQGQLAKLQDSKGADFCLGATHEEVITDVLRNSVKSYKELPLSLYQIQTKFRDEIRPRFGLMRAREFIMKDAYTFTVSKKDSEVEYDKMFKAYKRIFKRCGLEAMPVEADTGAIGGERSHEFQILADSGEDAIVKCSICSYTANTELAVLGRSLSQSVDIEKLDNMTAVETPGTKTIETVGKYLGVEQEKTVKTLLYFADVEEGSESHKKPIMVLLRGDHELNEGKLQKFLKAQSLRMMTDEEIVELNIGPKGFLGPFKLEQNKLEVFVDYALENSFEMVVGACEVDKHFVHAAFGRDFSGELADLKVAQAGDHCGKCCENEDARGMFELFRGIEVGHIFNLGNKYSKALDVGVLDNQGRKALLEMGCYGIGVGRTAAAAVEQCHDEKGIVWPKAIAPYQVYLMTIGKNPDLAELADGFYEEAMGRGIEVLYDDRKERPGVKFKDADLLGLPYQIVFGKNALETQEVELNIRQTGEKKLVKMSEVFDLLG